MHTGGDKLFWEKALEAGAAIPQPLRKQNLSRVSSSEFHYSESLLCNSDTGVPPAPSRQAAPRVFEWPPGRPEAEAKNAPP
jgi:hypothetical protein